MVQQCFGSFWQPLRQFFLEAGPVHSVGAMESMRFLTLRQVIAEGLVLVAGKGLLKGWTCSDRRQKLSSKV
jgi:hypothetical protein